MGKNEANRESVATPEEIISRLISSGDLLEMRKHLREMIDTYLLLENEPKYRNDVYFTFVYLDNCLRSCEKIHQHDSNK